MITILFLGSNPTDTGRLELSREVRAIKERLRGASHGALFQVEQEESLRIRDLVAALLRHKPQIVHFSGHGNDAGELLVEDDAGKAVSLDAKAVSDLFKELSEEVRCVVLNACFTEVQARQIAEHIDCVVGTSSAIEDEVAIHFAAGFYQALGFGENVGRAFRLGLVETGLEKHAVPDTTAPSESRNFKLHLPSPSPAPVVLQLIHKEAVDPNTVRFFEKGPDLPPLRAWLPRAVQVLLLAVIVFTVPYSGIFAPQEFEDIRYIGGVAAGLVALVLLGLSLVTRNAGSKVRRGFWIASAVSVCACVGVAYFHVANLEKLTLEYGKEKPQRYVRGLVLTPAAEAKFKINRDLPTLLGDFGGPPALPEVWDEASIAQSRSRLAASYLAVIITLMGAAFCCSEVILIRRSAPN